MKSDNLKILYKKSFIYLKLKIKNKYKINCMIEYENKLFFKTNIDGLFIYTLILSETIKMIFKKFFCD